MEYAEWPGDVVAPGYLLFGFRLARVPGYNSAMDLNSGETHELLRQAREKAEKLIKNLKAKQVELDANPPLISPEKLLEGRAALANAIASAERMLKSLNEAQRIASVETN